MISRLNDLFEESWGKTPSPFGRAMTYLTHLAFFAPKGLRHKAQGCRFGYPRNRKQKSSQPQGGCVSAANYERAQPRCGCRLWIVFFPQGSRSPATLGSDA